MLDLSLFEATSNLALVGPSRLTIEQFYAVPVSEQQLRARQCIYRLEEVLNSQPLHLDSKSIEPVHRFCNGVYTREVTFPAGSIIVGKRHAQEHLVTMTRGFCTCLTERGWEDMAGCFSFHSPAGEKRVLFIHEDTTWITTHRTDETTLEGVEKDLILTEQTSLPHKYTETTVEKG